MSNHFITNLMAKNHSPFYCSCLRHHDVLKECPSIEMGTAAHYHAAACAMDIHAYPMMYKIKPYKNVLTFIIFGTNTVS